MSEPLTPSVEPVAESTGPIVAKAGRYYRNARYLMTLGLLIMGGFFLYDGYVRYPANNKKIEDVSAAIDQEKQGSAKWVELDQLRQKLGTPKTGTDLALQKVLGYALPVAALAYLLYFLNKSRGEIRLENDRLTVPGHPTVALSDIQSVDSSLWKKKGIAYVNYTAGGQSGKITLDDFVYQQKPVDTIYDRILAAKSPAADAIVQ